VTSSYSLRVFVHRCVLFKKTRKDSIHCVECPDDFTYNSSMNGCYKVVTRNLQWPAAGLECRRLHKDAHLLIINDAEEQSAVAEMLSSINRQYYFVFLIFFHIFLTIEALMKTRLQNKNSKTKLLTSTLQTSTRHCSHDHHCHHVYQQNYQRTLMPLSSRTRKMLSSPAHCPLLLQLFYYVQSLSI